MNRFLAIVFACLLASSPVLFASSVRAQAGFDDDRVMLQGFYWESYRHGHSEKFPAVRRQAVVRNRRRHWRRPSPTGVSTWSWLPPPSFAGGAQRRLQPEGVFRLDNSYGTFSQHRAMLEALLENGVEPVADIVINHRDGSTGWAGFQEPRLGDVGRSARPTRRSQTSSPASLARPRPNAAQCEERPTEYTRARRHHLSVRELPRYRAHRSAGCAAT